MRMTRKLEEQIEIKQREKEGCRKKRNEELKIIVKEWKQTKLDMEQKEHIQRKFHETAARKQRYANIFVSQKK